MHYFQNLEPGEDVSNRVYDMASNQAGVFIEITKDTAISAVAVIT